jgi:predicted flap endonuclease-1-like 5' DNA nuclease
VPPPVIPRSFDPVQPRIEVLRRPPPRPMPKLIDPSRFERALMGPDPNEGVPRKAIPEICPAVLKPVTGADRPDLQEPPPLPSEPETSQSETSGPQTLPPPVAVIEPAGQAIIPPALSAETETSTELDAEAPLPEEPPVKRTSLSDATTSAAASAVAAAKAAAAASIVRTLRDDATSTTEPGQEEPVGDEKPEATQVDQQVAGDQHEDIPASSDRLDDAPIEDALANATLADAKPVDATPEQDSQPIEENTEETAEQFAEEPAATPQPAAAPAIEGGDDFQRIRAIDADLEQRLKAEGIDSFEHIAAWSASDVDRVGQLLGISDRIDREQWIEQAQILAKGGETYYSRNRLAAQKAAAAAPEAAGLVAEQTSAPFEKTQSATEPAPAPAPAGETSASEPDEPAVPEPEKPASAAEPTPQLSGVAAAIQGRSVAEMAAAAAAAIAAASASVTRGLKPIEPISPLSKVDPKISIPAKLSDAIKEKEASAATPARTEVAPPRPMTASSLGPHDDLKRIRGVGVLIEKRLNAMGIARYEQIANWTSGEIDRVSQVLEFKGRIEREGWVEQARILLNGGQTEFSRRVDRGEVDTSRET